MTNYYFPIIYIVPLISIDDQASPRLFIAPEIRHEKISYKYSKDYHVLSMTSFIKTLTVLNVDVCQCLGVHGNVCRVKQSNVCEESCMCVWKRVCMVA